MGMPENQQNRMNITPDGVVYEVLDDGTISKIARVLPNNEIELFANTKVVSEHWNCPNCGEKEIKSKFCPECGCKRSEQKVPEKVSPKSADRSKTGKLVLVLFLLVAGVLYNVRLTSLEIKRSKEERTKIIQSLNNLEEWRRKVDTTVKTMRESWARKRTIGKLAWSDRSYGAMKWQEAKQYCEDLYEGGYSDWRLPNIDELRTLIKNCYKTATGGECKVSEKSECLSESCWGSCSCDGKSNNGGYYSKLGDDDNVRLWSSSVLSGNSDYRWYVYFYNGNVYYRNVGDDLYVRCVR